MVWFHALKYRKIRPIELSRGLTWPGQPAWVAGWGLTGSFPAPSLQIAKLQLQQDDYR